jgi:hypothetical protein
LKSAAFERDQAVKYCDYIIDSSQSLQEVVEEFKTII